jgi:hypothetical protein
VERQFPFSREVFRGSTVQGKKIVRVNNFFEIFKDFGTYLEKHFLCQTRDYFDNFQTYFHLFYGVMNCFCKFIILNSHGIYNKKSGPLKRLS